MQLGFFYYVLISFFSSVVEQIFTHLYPELFPEMRYGFREPVCCMNPDNKNNVVL